MKKMLIAAAFAVSMFAFAGCATDPCGTCPKPAKPVCQKACKPACKPTCEKPVVVAPVCEVKPVVAAPVCEAPAPKAPKAVCNTCPPRVKKTCNSCKTFKFKMPKCNKCVAPAPKAPKCSPCEASTMNRVASAQPTCTVVSTPNDAPNFSGAGISYTAAQ